MQHRFLTLMAIMTLSVGALVLARQGTMSKTDRDLYKQILLDVHKDIEENYYDPAYRGIDLDAVFKEATDKVAAASTTTEAIDIITNTLFRFDDSHTRFFPPPRAVQADYGWMMTAIGDLPLVTRVDPSSDAAAQGLAPGDCVLALNRFTPSRANLWQIQHYYGAVRPQAQQHVVVRKPDGSERTFDIKSKITRRQVVTMTNAIAEYIVSFIVGFDMDYAVDPAVIVWRMTSFRDSDLIGPFIGRARKAKALVLDLRDNYGGSADGLKALIGWLFDRDVHVMTTLGRKGEQREIAKRRAKPFLGRLVVLVNSRSASASEVLARIVQLEKRGAVLGDRSAGAVMTSLIFPHKFGVGNVTFYATSVTVSDVRMSDGGRLENVGVVPDELLLPTPADLAAGRDPVLARAVALAGGSLTPDQAGKLYSGK
jgi:carboxyl-terminal processing protease